MFLPSQLPNGLRPRSEAEAAGEEEMGGRARRARPADRDEMLDTSVPMAGHQPGTSAQASAGFVARSWARISGRRRRQKRRMAAVEERREQRLATTSTTVEGLNGLGQAQAGPEQQALAWPSAIDSGAEGGGNLARLAHLEGEEEEERRKRHFLGRGMDRLRRSIRRSLHRGSQSGQALTHSSSDGLPASSSSSNGPRGAGSKAYCQSDEIAVRSAACSFPVKYLGACEVFESRGMSVCESALQHLRTRKRAIKALMYVSGDGIRVVDQENNRGLIVDQTIEKVSFCSPDRHHEKGFAYICREGATRRWMCHGFHAAKDSGERLSHAVGCAFTVCLEKKRKRDAESTAQKSAQALATSLHMHSPLGQPQQPQSPSGQVPEGPGPNEQFARSNQGYRSFRPLSISERRADPQKAILVEQPRAQQPSLDSPSNVPAGTGLAATPRPSANPTLFDRTGSLRGPSLCPSPDNAAPPKAPFNRFNSLQNRNGPRPSLPKMSLHNEPIWEGEDEREMQLEGGQPPGNGQNWPATGSNRFYRTLPHSLPNFGQGINNCSLFGAIPPTIPEEHKQPGSHLAAAEMDSSSSPPADPFTSDQPKEGEPQQKVCAEDWLERTFQRAASISTSGLPRSATTNWIAGPASQSRWAKFPQSQSFQADWPVGSSHCSATSSPPVQPPPPLPAWLSPAPTGSNPPPPLAPLLLPSPAISAPLPMPKMAKTIKPLSPQFGGGQDEADQSGPFKNHLRRASGNRRIEYQLLQETDVSLSPPKSESVLGRAIGPNGAGENAADPFDVNWSQRVLEETAKQRQNGQKRKGAEGGDPFGAWDLAPSASVDV